MIDKEYPQNKLKEVVYKFNTSLPDELKDKIIQQLDETLGKRIELEVLSKLSKDDLAIYEEALGEDGQDVAFQFACTAIENIDDFIKAVIDEFCKEYEETMTK